MPPSRRVGPATAVAALLVVVAVLAAALGSPMSLAARDDDPLDLRPLPTPEMSVSPLPEQSGEALPDPPSVPTSLITVIQVLVVLALLALAVLVVRYAVRGWRLDRGARGDDDVLPGDEGDEGLPDAAVAALREGVRAAARALDEDVPPGDAVISAWVRVEEGAAATGVVRDRAQTATEFTLDVLDATAADPAATRELLGLYLAARFGAHPVAAADVHRARELLEVVARGLVRRTDDRPADAAAGSAGPPAGAP